MATFNGERYLAEQLESFCSQTRRPDELIVCDDRSTDSTLKILQEFSKRASFEVHVHQNPARMNFSRNFERAISLCSGDVIFVSDQDDVWFPEKLQEVCEMFERDDRLLAILNGEIIANADLTHNDLTLLDNHRSLGMGPGDLIAGCATALRRQWAAVLLPLPPAADSLFDGGFLTYDRWINELSVLLRLRGFIETPLQYWRRYGSNASEHALHSSEGVRPGQLLADRVSSAPTHAWSRRVEVLDLYDKWIGENESAIGKLGGAIDHARSAIASERRHTEARIALASLPFLRRASKVTRLWSAGGYRYFNGWKSALNDLVRGSSRPNASS
jgi:glycosyltransferase involved in cell wall biosynthesis